MCGGESIQRSPIGTGLYPSKRIKRTQKALSIAIFATPSGWPGQRGLLVLVSVVE